jgi:hypothetical protein
MNLNRLPVDQRHILDEEPENTFSLPRFHRRIIPYSREVGGQRQELLASLGIDPQSLLLCLLLVLFLRLGQGTELVIPLRFQAIGNETIIGVDLHVATASEFSLVLCPHYVTPPQRVGFGNPCLNFLLNGEGNL